MSDHPKKRIANIANSDGVSMIPHQFPQFVSFRDGSNSRSTCRFNALMMSMRAIMVGPLSPTTGGRASTAAR